jgi:hypothetical protein
MIKDDIFSVLHQIPTSDLSLESLAALIAIMLAQAQEAFCLKAIQGTYTTHGIKLVPRLLMDVTSRETQA